MSIELIHGDCMDYMRELPDNAFDLAVVAPPYGIGESGGNESRARNNKGGHKILSGYAKKDWDKEPPEEGYFAELERVSRNQIIWGANHFIDRVRKASPCWLVWDKQNSGDFTDCEMAYTSFKTAVRKFQFRWNGMIQGDMKRKEARIHPTQKPVKLYEWLLANYAEPGQRILDTHLGSGSSAIAAHYFGCDFVGIELDPDYYAAAKDRFDRETAQVDMFAGGVA